MAVDLPSNYRSLNANQKLLRFGQIQTQVRDIAKTSRPADLYQIGAQAAGIITSRNQPQYPSHPRSPSRLSIRPSVPPVSSSPHSLDTPVEHAQKLRWAAFEEHLSVEHLRSYLRALPDFEDVLAEERAMKHALHFRNFPIALHFLHEWPAHRQAADLIVARHGEINGNLYYLLDPAARW